MSKNTQPSITIGNLIILPLILSALIILGVDYWKTKNTINKLDKNLIEIQEELQDIKKQYEERN
jgi:hypothetical protein